MVHFVTSRLLFLVSVLGLTISNLHAIHLHSNIISCLCLELYILTFYFSRRRAEREARGEHGGRGGRAQRPTHLGNYMPRRDNWNNNRRNQRRLGDNRRHQDNQERANDWDEEYERNGEQSIRDEEEHGDKSNDGTEEKRFGRNRGANNNRGYRDGQRQRRNRDNKEKNYNRDTSRWGEQEHSAGKHGRSSGEHGHDHKGTNDRQDRRGSSEPRQTENSKSENWDEPVDTGEHSNKSVKPENLNNDSAHTRSDDGEHVRSKNRLPSMPRDHSKSLFSEETFMSKVFSLSSEDNSLVVKQVSSTATRRVIGRGRGRGQARPTSGNNPTPGKIAATTNSHIPKATRASNDITVISPLEERLSNNKDTDTSARQDDEVVQVSSSPEKKEAEVVGGAEDSGSMANKPKRYSSRRQQNKAADGEPVVEDSVPKSG